MDGTQAGRVIEARSAVPREGRMEHTDKVLATLLERIDAAVSEHAGTAAGIAVKAVQIEGIVTLATGAAMALGVLGLVVSAARLVRSAIRRLLADDNDVTGVLQVVAAGVCVCVSVVLTLFGSVRLLSPGSWIAALSPESAIALRIMEALVMHSHTLITRTSRMTRRPRFADAQRDSHRRAAASAWRPTLTPA
jgi:hypothetical protein